MEYVYECFFFVQNSVTIDYAIVSLWQNFVFNFCPCVMYFRFIKKCITIPGSLRSRNGDNFRLAFGAHLYWRLGRYLPSLVSISEIRNILESRRRGEMSEAGGA